ncbi:MULTISPECIES: LamG-like jellyroll fold domain-containing protein [Acidobacterium]|nr:MULTISPECIES: LamG-like jellyroll fold domain-containing protein [Acidobacterium]
MTQTYGTPTTNNPPQYGPFNAIFLEGGTGLTEKLETHDTVQMASSPWTLYAWIKPNVAVTAPVLIGGMGETSEEYPRMLALSAKDVMLWDGADNTLRFPLPGGRSIAAGTWHFVAATFDGTQFHVYVDGTEAGHGTLLLGSVSPVLSLAPARGLPGGFSHFGGLIEGFTLLRHAMSSSDLAALSKQRKDLDVVDFEHGSEDWPIQSRQWIGYRQPQSPQTLPHSKAPFSKPVAEPLPAHRPGLTPKGVDQWMIGDWNLQAAPKVHATAEELNSPQYDPKGWMAATVPGTVLTTMVDRGIYPNPYYGLNNMAIPESLNKQDYWYRTEFETPKSAQGRQLSLDFEGINYKAKVWLNGHELGTIKGAFIRGAFDVTPYVKASGKNVLLVKISPPPHPGIPQEQSVLGGPGMNGGEMVLDGPTFMDTEGWDWIPAIRDRDSGLWQPVMLEATGAVKIGDPQVVTTLPLPSLTSARVRIDVPLQNTNTAAVQGTLTASFEGVTVTKKVTLASGANSIQLTPSEYPQLVVQHPRLWWPNGYGKPNLYHLKLTFATSNGVSDMRTVQFGMREVSYQLGLMTPGGQLKQIIYDPSRGDVAKQALINIRHEAILQVPPQAPYPGFYSPDGKKNWTNWVYSLTPAAMHSPAVTPAPASDAGTRTFLVILVNGVRIAARGGSWGMDDAMKNVSRAHLEPYFKLEQQAGVNIIRNWQGQDTEQTFYNLADEYGLMVWNDFWESTQDSNLEAENPALFLKNARDTISHYRNHPSIVVWCGRNEGVPQPIINQGLDKWTRKLDGTRIYMPSSNNVNLQVSGPYRWQNPVLYYTNLNEGFSVETGTPSMSTLESFKAWTPKPDQWPIDDVWAYHDWHQSGNGDVHPFMDAVEAMFGAPTSLADFERKAQMLNYIDHRAIFEGMDAHLWQPNSGRMLWMTHPAWPSNVWEIYSYDYDTQASYYGVKKACEPLHVQLDLSNGNVQVVNTTREAHPAMTVSVKAYSLANQPLLSHSATVNSAADGVVTAFPVDLVQVEAHGVALVELKLSDASGKVVSRNLYWLASNMADYRALDRLPDAPVTATATYASHGSTVELHVTLHNTGSTASLQDKLTLLNAAGKRILPAYYSDNYVSLLPGESRQITITYPATAASGAPRLTLRGWNLAQHAVSVMGQ